MTAKQQAVDSGEFRRAAGRFASGVTIVTTRRDLEIYGITVSAFASFSIDPLQVLVSIWQGNRLHDMIRESGMFAVSVLGEDQRSVSEYFARPGRIPLRRSPAIREGLGSWRRLRASGRRGAPSRAGRGNRG